MSRRIEFAVVLEETPHGMAVELHGAPFDDVCMKHIADAVMRAVIAMVDGIAPSVVELPDSVADQRHTGMLH